MIVLLMPNLYFGEREYWNTPQPNPSFTQQNKLYGQQWTGLWGKKNPLGRHPFNILTEEIYND